MALGTYNRTPANRRLVEKRYGASYVFSQTTTAEMGAGALYAASARLSDSMSADMSPRFGFDARYAIAAEWTAELNAVSGVSPRYAFLSDVYAEVHMALPVVYAMADAVAMRASTSTFIHPAYGVLHGTMSAFFSGVQTKDVTMSFPGVVIPPGGVLVIDSETFTATLDGKNVIDQYEGDWLEFGRLLKDLRVSSGTSGDMHVSVLYRERYL